MQISEVKCLRLSNL